jgi:type II secretory pathway pseudopilin PulG
MSRNIAKHKPQSGFSLVELLVAMLVTMIVLGAATVLFRQALNATYTLTAKADMLQNARGALNQITRDISRAGNGLQTGGISLPSGTALAPRYGCDFNGVCYVAGGVFAGNQMYSITPGFQLGINNDAAQPTDVITILYSDTVYSSGGENLTLVPPCCGLEVAPGAAPGAHTSVGNNGDQVTINTAFPNTNPPLTDAVNGLTPGDVVVLTNINGTAAAVVTAVNTATGLVTFANNDALNFNQGPATVTGSIRGIANNPAGNPRVYPSTTAFRLIPVTYFLQAQPDGTRRLMRMVGAHPPVPVADNVVTLSFSYDVFNDTLNVNTANTTNALGNPNYIRKVNVSVTVRSFRPDPRTKRFDTLTLTTSLSPRSLGFKDRYQ